jgi:peptide subunit release factor 1 (eRF1)
MVSEIDKLIKERGLKAGDVEYHTIRPLENGGRVRALVIKGEKNVHIEYICPQCKHAGYTTQEWKEVGKGAKFRFSFKCDKCSFEIKVSKLKGGPKEKKT